MTPQELKNSILQLAIQGKLVEQRPEEGTAEELYQQIQAEKQRLIKECKIKKEKPLPEVTEDEIPFDIPENWKWIKLGNVVSVLGGKRIPAGRTLTTVNTGHKYIRVSDMKNGSIQVENLMYVPEDIYPSISKYIINKEDIYITVAGTIGKVGKIPDKLDGANLTENADRLVFSLLDQDWLIKTLESAFVQTQIADATTKVGQPKLAIKRIQEIIIPLPPLAEQKRIVAKIDELLPYIERYERAWSKLEELNKRFPIVLEKSILEMAIQGKLVEQRPEEGTGEELYQQIQDEKQRLIKEGKIKKEKPLPEITEDEIPFDIPESWKWVRLKSITLFIKAGGDKPKDFSLVKTEEHKVPVIANGVQNNGVIGYTNVATVDEPCITVSGRGTIGFSCIRTEPFCPIVRLLVLRIVNNVSLKYIQIVLTALLEKGVGTSIQQLTVPMLEPKLIPLPPLSEQERIVKKLEEILPLCEKLKK